MSKTYTFPHWKTSVIDESIRQVFVREYLPLFKPIFFGRAQSGPAGKPIWSPNINEFRATFGEGTVDNNTKYYSKEAFFMEGLFARQGCFFVRMVDETADFGSVVLEVLVKDKQIQQFERDSNGKFILDEDTGEKIPVTDESGASVFEDGVELTWRTRPLNLEADVPETISNLQPTTTTDGVVYPILAVKSKYVGAYSNDIGVKFFCDLTDIDDTLANAVGSIPYSFGAVKKTYGQDTVSAILSDWQNRFETFVAKPKQTYERTARKVSFNEILKSSYSDNELPFEVNLYSENIKAIGEKIIAVEPDDTTLTDPYLVNLAMPYNINGIPMPHVALGEDSIILNSSTILYMQNGSDGSIDDETIEALTRQYLKDLVYPELLDQPRYPFSAIIDTGVSLKTKEAFIEFLGTHDAFSLILSTQDANLGRYNTKAEDYSLGAALFAQALLQPESTEKGTECCRVEIYQQSGRINDSRLDGIIPFTYDIMLKKSGFMSTPHLAGQPEGIPSSLITEFSEYNWMPCDPDHKQRSWDSGLNYAQHADMNRIHWPGFRTVYRYDTSVLSDAFYSNAVVIVKHIVRWNWTLYAGSRLSWEALREAATRTITQDLRDALGDYFSYEVDLYQTETEAALGYATHVQVTLYGTMPQRVWNIDIVCRRA